LGTFERNAIDFGERSHGKSKPRFRCVSGADTL
jgi:hypothetical protein